MSVSQPIPQRMTPDGPILSPGSKRDINIHYPESFSAQHRFSLQSAELAQNYKREQKRELRKNRNRARYRTQPVTFDEIKEVDEENIEPGINQDNTENSMQVGSLTNVMSPADLRLNFLEFSKSLQESVHRKVSVTRPSTNNSNNCRENNQKT